MHLQNFNYNGTIIQRRDDGFINLTQMCQANGKRLDDFLGSQRALSTIFTLYASQSIPAVHPVQSMDSETWGHISLAAELAYQSDPDFSVWFTLTFYGISPINDKCLDIGSYKEWKEKVFPWINDPSNQKEKKGTVYFILNNTRNLLKIGFTSGRSCHSRLSAFQSGAVGETFSILGEIRGTLSTESAFHTFLSDYRFKGEWFYYTDEVKKFVESIEFV